MTNGLVTFPYKCCDYFKLKAIFRQRLISKTLSAAEPVNVMLVDLFIKVFCDRITRSSYTRVINNP